MGLCKQIGEWGEGWGGAAVGHGGWGEDLWVWGLFGCAFIWAVYLSQQVLDVYCHGWEN